MNFKDANYKTRWVELPDVTSVRTELGVAPNRTHPDGSSFATLPIIKDVSRAEVVGDSFEIAQYLDKIYPSSPSLIPPGTVGLQKAFNIQVDAIFTNHVLLMVPGMPWNPQTAEASRQTFVKRGTLRSWDDLTLTPEARTAMLRSFESALGDLKKCYEQTDGAFLDGTNATYADLIVGGWINTVKATTAEWPEISKWLDGFLTRLGRALIQYGTVG